MTIHVDVAAKPNLPTVVDEVLHVAGRVRVPRTIDATRHP